MFLSKACTAAGVAAVFRVTIERCGAGKRANGDSTVSHAGAHEPNLTWPGTLLTNPIGLSIERWH